MFSSNDRYFRKWTWAQQGPSFSSWGTQMALCCFLAEDTHVLTASPLPRETRWLLGLSLSRCAGLLCVPTAMVRAEPLQRDFRLDSWPDLHRVTSQLLSRGCWRFPMAGSQWAVSKCELLPRTRFPASQSGEFPMSSVNSTGYTAIYPQPTNQPTSPRQKSQLLERPSALSIKCRSPDIAHAHLWTICWSQLVLGLPRGRETERPRAGEALEISECNPLIFHTQPREATCIAQGHRVNYGRTGAALEVSAFPVQGYSTTHRCRFTSHWAVLPLGDRSLEANV